MEAQASCQLLAQPAQPKNLVLYLEQQQDKGGEFFKQLVELPMPIDAQPARKLKRVVMLNPLYAEFSANR